MSGGCCSIWPGLTSDPAHGHHTAHTQLATVPVTGHTLVISTMPVLHTPQTGKKHPSDHMSYIITMITHMLAVSQHPMCNVSLWDRFSLTPPKYEIYCAISLLVFLQLLQTPPSPRHHGDLLQMCINTFPSLFVAQPAHPHPHRETIDLFQQTAMWLALLH